MLEDVICRDCAGIVREYLLPSKEDTMKRRKWLNKEIRRFVPFYLRYKTLSDCLIRYKRCHKHDNKIRMMGTLMLIYGFGHKEPHPHYTNLFVLGERPDYKRVFSIIRKLNMMERERIRSFYEDVRNLKRL